MSSFSPPFKRRNPHIVKAGSSPNSINSRRKSNPIFCPHCGFATVYVPAYHMQYCNNCGTTLDPDPRELQQRLAQERQANESTYSIADGSQPYSADVYSQSNLMYGKHYRRTSSSNNGGGGGITRNTKHNVENKFHPKSDMDKVFERETNVLERSGGNTITSQHTEIRKSPDINF
jgi:hypothetical protein